MQTKTVLIAGSNGYIIIECVTTTLRPAIAVTITSDEGS